VHDVTAGHLHRGEVPGLVTLVSPRGAVHVDAIGVKTRGRDDPIQGDSIFRISSMTKPITVRDLLMFRIGFGQMVRRATRTPTASRRLLLPRCRRNRPRPRSAAAYRKRRSPASWREILVSILPS
jgi:hypothetical protein